MCGRFALKSPPSLIAERFGVAGPLPNLTARFNAAPLQDLPVVRLNPDTGERNLHLLRWGLVPVWAKDATIGSKLINARCETLTEKASFRTAFHKRRCLVPADAFYEWKQAGNVKQPYAITTTDNGPFAMAGLWEAWKNPDGLWERTFTIITTTANALLSELHDRMPVILPSAQWPAWLGEEPVSDETLRSLLRPYPAPEMRMWPVSRDVGNVRNDRPDLLDPLEQTRLI
ncbi:SOS response-associated peptidase [Azospirillum canadense]|uniref:SOS response-associated peptidase n=1 Tax=Azospirillum canadense TaxID=403962 RepID=UPI0022270FEA|nr:SOS response-associated peptidase [Azospirillum canadense]MCW2239591.1 putative SOS response-associated peptidase YedK [Azospirillum canadense]